MRLATDTCKEICILLNSHIIQRASCHHLQVTAVETWIPSPPSYDLAEGHPVLGLELEPKYKQNGAPRYWRFVGGWRTKE